MLFGVVYFVSVSVFGSYPSGWKIQHLCAFYMCDVQYCMSVFGSILHPGELLVSSSQFSASSSRFHTVLCCNFLTGE